MKKSFFGSSVQERRARILDGNPTSVLIAMSLPTLMMAVVQSLIPLTDGLFLNNSAGYIVAGAVGVSANVINILNALSQGMATAAMAIIGQLNGLGDFRKVREVISQIFAFGLLVGAVLAVLLLPIAQVTANLLGAKEQLHDSITLYLSCYAPTIPLLFTAALFNAVKNATGMPEVTFYRMILLLLLKIMFNALFLSVLHLGVVGAAAASFCSYCVVGVWMFYDLVLRPSDLQIQLKGFRFDRGEIAQILHLGTPTMLSFMLVNMGFFLINREVVRFGELALNAQTISSNINAMAFTVPSSIGTTVTTMVSINIAAGQEKAARRAYWTGFALAEALALAMCAFFIPLASRLVSLFLNNPQMTAATRQEIASIAVPSLNIYTVSVIAFAVFMVTQGAIVGLGKTKIPLPMGVLRIWLFRYVFIRLTAQSLGVFSVFWGNLFSNFMAAAIYVVILLRADWQRDLIRQAGPGKDERALRD